LENSIKNIAKFIRSDKLKNWLRRDAVNFKILNERDLEHRIYHYLSNRINEKKFLIFTNKTFSGMTKSGRSRKGRFVMPDIIIRDRHEKDKIRLVIELKADKRAVTAYPERVVESKFNDDFDKLNQFMKDRDLQKELEYGFFIYLYRDPKWTEKKIESRISKKFHYNKLEPIAINRWWNAKKNDFYSESKRKEMKKNFDSLHTIRVGDNHKKKKKPTGKRKGNSRAKKHIKNSKKVAGAKTAWGTSTALQKKMRPETRERYGLPSKGKKPRKGR